MNREEIKKFINKMLETKKKKSVSRLINGKKYLDIKSVILKETSYLPEETTIGERIYHVLNDMYKRPICPVCKIKYLKFHNSKYHIYCSRECLSNSPAVKEKRINTCLKIYGCENVFQNKEIQKKSKKTNKKKYGYEYAAQNKGIQEKIENTNIKNYNFKNVFQNKEIQKKLHITKNEKNILKVEEFLKTINLKIIDNYNNCQKINIFKCLKCGKEFESCFFNIQQGKQCPYCSTNYTQSKEEIEIYEYLISILTEEIIQNENQILRNIKTNYPLELDFHIPEKNIAIEYNGLYWHSERFKDKDYHLMKTNLCKEKGLRLIHIFEDEWIFKKDIVKEKLKQILGVENKKINLDHCSIKEINNRTLNKFVEKHDIEDNRIIDSINLGAFYKDELIAIATFDERDINNFELRICSIDQMDGIENKLLSYFKNNYEWEEIYSYVDLRWGDGKTYEELEFELLEQTEPDYWHLKGIQRINKLDLRKEEGYLRIYDCGYLKYKLTNKEK